MFKVVSYKVVLGVIILSIGAELSMAQPSSSAGDPIEQVARTLKQVDALVESSNTTKILDGATVVELAQVESSDIDAWAQAQKSSYSSVSGLSFHAGYDRKYGTGSDDLYEDIYAYKNRFNAMLSWNILESGLVGRSLNEELVDLESQKLLLDKRSELSAEQIRLQFQSQQQVLDSYLNNVYTTQVKIYEDLIALLETLRNKGQATMMELSQMNMEMQVARGAVRETPVKLNGLFNLSEYLSTQVRISDKDVELLTQGSLAVEQSKLDEQIVSNQVADISYWDEVSLSPYLKAQHYSNTGFTTSRMTANIGVTATLPLFSGTKNRRTEAQVRSILASNSTSTTTTSVGLTISETATELNKNLERLQSAEKLEELYSEQIATAREAYQHKQLGISDLAQYYLKLFMLKADIVEIINDRESLKTKLLLITI